MMTFVTVPPDNVLTRYEKAGGAAIRFLRSNPGTIAVTGHGQPNCRRTRMARMTRIRRGLPKAVHYSCHSFNSGHSAVPAVRGLLGPGASPFAPRASDSAEQPRIERELPTTHDLYGLRGTVTGIDD